MGYNYLKEYDTLRRENALRVKRKIAEEIHMANTDFLYIGFLKDELCALCGVEEGFISAYECLDLNDDEFISKYYKE